MAKTFKESVTLDPNTGMVLDSLNLAFRWKHKGALNFLDEYVDTVESLRKSYKASKLFVLGDWGSDFRKAIYPEYKQNRKDKQEQQSPAEQEYFEAFFAEYLKVLDYYRDSKYPMLRLKGVEADDIAGLIVKRRKTLGLNNLWLISSDRDWDLYIDTGISRFSYVTRKEITCDNWNEHYDVQREDYISLKCLTGDTGDNIPGINKVGPVKAKSLIEEYGSALDVAASIPLDGKYVYIKNVNEFGAEAIMRNYKLMDLVTFCEEAIGDERIELINKELELKNYV